MSFSLRRRGEIIWLEPEGFREAGVLAAFSTRRGGISAGAYASLNLGFSSGDHPDRVGENRRRFFSALGVDPAAVALANQVHGRSVLEVTDPPEGPPATESGGALGDADALATGRPGTFLFQTYADCVPVFVADPEGGVVGLAHSGWRGTAAGVGEALVRHLVAVHGSRPEALLAAVGPAIAPPHYEVGDEVREAILGAYPWAGAHLRDGQADLRAVVRGALLASGLTENHVQVEDLATYPSEDLLFSYRRDGARSGRMAGLIGLLSPQG